MKIFLSIRLKAIVWSKPAIFLQSVVAFLLHIVVVMYIWYMLTYNEDLNKALKLLYGDHPIGLIVFPLFWSLDCGEQWGCPRMVARVILFLCRLFLRLAFFSEPLIVFAPEHPGPETPATFSVGGKWGAPMMASGLLFDTYNLCIRLASVTAPHSVPDVRVSSSHRHEY
jgi:hypothetical protein